VSSAVRIRLFELAIPGRPTPHDGNFVVEFRPGAMDRHGALHGGILRTSRDPADALSFPSALEAFEFWRQANGLRPDGKPNRPLTAWTIEFEPVQELEAV
jgi:hypothetical protein